jgi:hypothetical protein
VSVLREPLWRLLAAIFGAMVFGMGIVGVAVGDPMWATALVALLVIGAWFIHLIWPDSTVEMTCVECSRVEKVDWQIAAAHGQWRCNTCWIGDVINAA